MILEINSKPIDFHQLVERSLNSILIVGATGEILYCNKACLDLLNIKSTTDIIFKNVCQFIHPPFHKICMERLTKVFLNQETINTEVKMIRNNGEIIDIESIAAPFYLENQVFAQIIMQNITDHKLHKNIYMIGKS
ncbi:PAS domain-containing protein [Neobacillus cucumis]|uniref:PAS domain-containing protein n=1 Tax=Neobacillus cucumis TaxID=1740721 RepID=UPI0021555DF3|nr:PAS domain-containing protein [Neobacillus cucumis]